MKPVEPPASPWRMPHPSIADEDGLVAVGADLEPGTLLAAYRSGLFPMPLDGQRGGTHIGWWSPQPRGIIPIDGLVVHRSLQRSRRTFSVTRDSAFRQVMERCGDPQRPHGWITPEFVDAYDRLHTMGWTHSVEVWRDDELVGGVYGVRIGGFFAGESMFHAVTDASKVALVALVEWLRDSGATLFDVQWTTPHLRSLGAIDVDRDDYLRMLAAAVRC